MFAWVRFWHIAVINVLVVAFYTQENAESFCVPAASDYDRFALLTYYRPWAALSFVAIFSLLAFDAFAVAVWLFRLARRPSHLPPPDLPRSSSWPPMPDR